MDGGAWWAAVHGVAKSQTWLSDFTFTFHFHALEEEMATHSSVLAWRIPGTEEPGGLPSMGSHRVRHDWNDLAAAAANMHRIHFFASPRTETRELSPKFYDWRKRWCPFRPEWSLVSLSILKSCFLHPVDRHSSDVLLSFTPQMDPRGSPSS